MYTLNLAQLALLEKCEQAIIARFPQLAPPSALPLLGADRLVTQGLTEDGVAYAGRLRRAFEDWQVAGNAFSVLGQVLGYLSTFTPRVRAVSAGYHNVWRAPVFDPTTGAVLVPRGILVQGSLSSSLWDSYEVGDAPPLEPDHLLQGPFTAGWDWDSASSVDGSGGWWWWWLVVYSTGAQAFAGAAPAWGTPGLKWGKSAAHTWGLNVASSVGAGLRALLGLWKPASAPCRNIILSFDDALFDPAQPSGGGVNPDGTFGRWSKIVGGVYVPSRFSNARYLNGVI